MTVSFLLWDRHLSVTFNINSPFVRRLFSIMHAMDKKPLGRKRWRAIALLLAAFLLTTQDAIATNYVTFSDGRLFVFPDSCVKAVETEDGMLTITTQDDMFYSYSLEGITSISQELTKELPTITSYKFEKDYNYQVFSNITCEIGDGEINASVAGIGKRLTATFKLSDTRAKAFVDGVEQITKVSRLRFDGSRTYTVGFEGDMILLPTADGHYAFSPFGREYVVNVDFLTDHSTTVPRIDINTVDSVNITSKKYYVDAQIIIDGKGVFPSMTDSVQIKGRGHTSWSSDPTSKNPYRLKFADKVKPLGMTKGKNWVLLNNKYVGSMLTNAIGMKAASLLGVVAANHIIPVNLYINGTYKGSYNFTEKIGLANNSVDLDDESAATLLELDSYFDEDATQKFRSSYYNLPVNIKDPDFADSASTVLTISDIKRRFNAFMTKVYKDEDFTDLVDADCLARFLLLNELICNYEILHPKSTYCYNENVLDENSKFIFGPGWDFDWAYGFEINRSYYTSNPTVDYYTKVSFNNVPFFTKLRNNDKVSKRTYEILKEFVKNGLDELCEFCQDYYLYAKPSLRKNKQEIYDGTDYAAQASRAATWLRQRAEYLLANLEPEPPRLGDVNCDGEINITDISDLIDYILTGKMGHVNLTTADANCDGEINISDVTTIIDILLIGN